MSEKTYELEAESELRVEIPTTAELTLVSGAAEVYGTEMVVGKLYTLRATNIAVFTWKGGTIKLSGNAVDSPYVAKETPMLSYINVHAALDQRRTTAAAASGTGPRTMIVGPANVGKSTLAMILANYAARVGRRPIYLDLDVGEGAAGMPGTLTAMTVDRPLDIESRFARCKPLTFHYGHGKINESTRLFTLLVDKLAKAATRRAERDPVVASSGYIVNTSDLDKDMVMSVAAQFEIDVVMVLDNERMYNELQAAIPGSTVVKLTKSGGVVPRDMAAKEAARLSHVKQYYYGSPGQGALHPALPVVHFDDVSIFKIGAPPVPAACLPFGADPFGHETQTVPIKPTQDLVHACFTVSSAPAGWQDTEGFKLIETEGLGFVSVQNVDMEERTMTLLAPAQGMPALPCTLLLCEQTYSDASN